MYNKGPESNMSKTYSVLSAKESLARKRGKAIVLVGGSFDILHIGHIRFLANAKKLGNILIVALNSDTHIKSYKELGRPIIPERQRAEVLESLKIVDHVLITNKGLYDPYIYKAIKPDILALGKEVNRKSSRLTSVKEIKRFYPSLKVAFVNKGAKGVSTSLIEKRIRELATSRPKTKNA